MAVLRFSVRIAHARGIVANGAVPLQEEVLATPRLAVGRDHLAMLGRDDAYELPATWGWNLAGALVAVLVEPGSGRAAWQGCVSRTELRRIARRAARALHAVGVFAAGGRMLLECRLELADHDPSVQRPTCQAAPPGVRHEPFALVDRLPPASEITCDAHDRDLVVWLAVRAQRELLAASHATMRAGEASVLRLLGRRCVLAHAGRRVPMFDVACCEPVALAQEKQATACALGELHVRAEGDSLWAGDVERHVCEDGGPGAILMTMRAARDLAHAGDVRVYAQLARLGGELGLARACVVLAREREM